ncbi:glutamine--tRNA ligase/YqeY domain fusion protein [Clostridium sp. CF011]|uniref:glutamine--tRNA ligase/YqeY domain fusion protein n=1 Tax=unclassified Clostridium TaxID=2614128 RepID=UPI001C0AF35C|nr:MULTISPECIES: glutamine--tRNA ligase/YqeY domain fusion protein [unclassified Clostridium]MBU3091435.1 glutamine--tRNA ligase/YqeY domain fusion protein [Clostridium sp. CF011]MBW9145167.1 glutamine--tRNA ligase/YqeY domain fusion protein [Clostridium sp. CM027]UVE40302.1 glutamine--tRNA ligase/YqeY domain fusion protein [Clostridium sp. CM027]WAG69246.1 glutamine--tRNA ligase/YqeY domain fusion protein [Clostridium sp. CF011]
MENKTTSSNFIRNIVKEDIESGKHKKIITRFPPEPNGYLHIGHAKSIILNFELADEFKGKTNLRFDDTNPAKEDKEYVKSIEEDVKWLGFKWDDLFFASNYFDEMYKRAVLLIKKNMAYVCDLTAEEMKEYRGTLREPGKESPYKNRTVEENLDLFDRMRKGEFVDGSKVLRAKINMSSPNINMRDPIIYRISHAVHHNTGDKWCIYPMYDYAHPIEDAIEGITHSICTLEFEDHRPLYDWVVNQCEMESKPRQIEFARLNITNTVMSKRNLKQLVDEGIVDAWDDPRMPTIAGLRRRGYTPEAIRNFCREIGVAKGNSTVDGQMLEHFIREDLSPKALRTMAVLRPLKVVITNYPEAQVEMLEIENNQENPEMGTRQVSFSREIYIEREDFMENPPKKYFRLFIGNEVRLKGAYFIKCNEMIKDADGNICEIHCTYDPETKSGSGFTGRKVKGTIHFVDVVNAVPAEFRLYEPLILDEKQEEGKTFIDQINPDSIEILQGFIEPNMKNSKPQDKFQFFRHGYFNVDSRYTTDDKIVFNRIASLKSSFKINK